MKGHFSQKQRNPQSNKPTRYPTQDCKSVFLERERERGIGTNGGWGGENGNGAAKVAGVFKAGNATSKTTVAVAELGQGTPEGSVLTFIRWVLPTLHRAGPTLPARSHGAASSGGRAPREIVVVEDQAPWAQAAEGVRRHCPSPRERDLR
jgi:hypothetical protein